MRGPSSRVNSHTVYRTFNTRRRREFVRITEDVAEAVRDAGMQLGGTVARVTQPYRVRGGRVPGSPARQDEAWLEIIEALRTFVRRAVGARAG